VFSIDEKMEILTEVDAYLGNQVDLSATIGLSVSTLNTIVYKRSVTKKSCMRCGPSVSNRMQISEDFTTGRI
jgi:hypothetical protein